MNSTNNPTPPHKMPGGAWKPSHDTPSASQLFPLFSQIHKLGTKGLLVPGLFTVGTGIALGAIANSGSPYSVAAIEWVLGAYLYSACLYFVYRACGKTKPIWLLAGSAFFTIISMIVYVTIRGAALSQLKESLDQMGPLQQFVTLFFQVAIPEELVKSIPILLGVLAGFKLASPKREQLGVLEPLDGVLLGAASATGFALFETLTNYAGPDLSGLVTLIVRFLQNVSVHVAYSACLGYYIGLAILKPAKRWQAIAIGLGTAVSLHAAWDTVADRGAILSSFVAFLSFCILATAILKARQISPMRRENWATTVSASSITVPPLEAQPPSLANPEAAPGVIPPPVPVAIGPLVLRVGATRVPLTPGRTLTEQELPGLAPAAGQMVAEVSANPRNPEILGLKNQSAGVWSVRDPEKGILKINPGQTFRVLPGTRVNFGSIFGDVEQE